MVKWGSGRPATASLSADVQKEQSVGEQSMRPIEPSKLLLLIQEKLSQQDDIAHHPLDGNTILSDLGLGSLALVSLIATVAAECEVDLPGEDVVSLLSAPSVGELAVALAAILVECLDAADIQSD